MNRLFHQTNVDDDVKNNYALKIKICIACKRFLFKMNYDNPYNSSTAYVLLPN